MKTKLMKLKKMLDDLDKASLKENSILKNIRTLGLAVIKNIRENEGQNCIHYCELCGRIFDGEASDDIQDKKKFNILCKRYPTLQEHDTADLYYPLAEVDKSLAHNGFWIDICHECTAQRIIDIIGKASIPALGILMLNEDELIRSIAKRVYEKRNESSTTS